MRKIKFGLRENLWYEFAKRILMIDKRLTCLHDNLSLLFFII